MDEIFTREIKHAENKINSCGVWYLCLWNYSGKKMELHNLSPFIQKYFHYIFVED